MIDEHGRLAPEGATAHGLTIDSVPPTHSLPDGITWVCAAKWLLEGD